MQVSVREMKNNLSKYLRRARAGADVVITDRGRPVARLMPMRSKEEEPAEDAARRIGALPWVRAGAGGKPKGAKRPIARRRGDALVSDLVIRDRI
jgi:prevent-host-death family protein